MLYLTFISIFIVQFLLPLLPPIAGNLFLITYFSPLLLISTGLIIYFVSRIFEINFRRPKVILKNYGYYIVPLLLLFSSNFLFVSLPTYFGVPLFWVKLGLGLLAAAAITLYLAVLKMHKGFDISRYNFLFIITQITYFLGLYSISNFYWALPSPASHLFLVLATYGLSWLLFYELFWLRGKKESISFAYISTLSLIAAEISLVASFWMTRYRFVLLGPKSGEPILGVPVNSILILVFVAYMGWGLFYHTSTSTLTRRVLYEYLLVTVFFIAFTLLTNNYQVN